MSDGWMALQVAADGQRIGTHLSLPTGVKVSSYILLLLPLVVLTLHESGLGDAGGNDKQAVDLDDCAIAPGKRNAGHESEGPRVVRRDESAQRSGAIELATGDKKHQNK